MTSWVKAGILNGKSDKKEFVCITEELTIHFTKGMFVLIEKNGLKVPFEITDFYLKNNQPFVKLFLFQVQEIQKWKNCSILVEKSKVQENKSANFIGYTVILASTMERIGQVVDDQTYSGNRVLTVEKSSGKKILIPFHKDFLLKKNKKNLLLNLAPHLLNIEVL